LYVLDAGVRSEVTNSFKILTEPNSLQVPKDENKVASGPVREIFRTEREGLVESYRALFNPAIVKTGEQRAKSGTLVLKRILIVLMSQGIVEDCKAIELARSIHAGCTYSGARGFSTGMDPARRFKPVSERVTCEKPPSGTSGGFIELGPIDKPEV